MDAWPTALLVVAIVAFFGPIAWLRTDETGGLPSPGEPGDADRVPPLDGS